MFKKNLLTYCQKIQSTSSLNQVLSWVLCTGGSHLQLTNPEIDSKTSKIQSLKILLIVFPLEK